MQISPGLPSVDGLALVVAQDQLGRRNRQPDRAVVLGQVQRVDRRGRRGLGQSVGLDQRRARDRLPLDRHRFLHGHAAAERDLQRGEIELREIRAVDQGVEQRVDAGEGRELILAHLLDEPRNVARIRNQHVFAAQRHEGQAVRGQREDVIQRQRRDDHLPPIGVEERMDPGACLHHVRDDVPVEQHRALRDARRSARVLQEGDVVVADRDAFQRALAALRQRVGKPYRPGQRVLRNHLLDASQNEVDDQALEAEQLADRGDDHLPDLGLADHVRDRIGEILDADDHFGAGVVQLVLEFARRVQRIDVHHRAARAQRAEQAYRILQDVGHHQCHARALLAALALQPRAEGGGKRVELGERDRLAHARERRSRAVLADAFLEDLAHRLVLVHVDVGRDALRILLEPDSFHDAPPPPAKGRRHGPPAPAGTCNRICLRTGQNRQIVASPATENRTPDGASMGACRPLNLHG